MIGRRRDKGEDAGSVESPSPEVEDAVSLSSRDRGPWDEAEAPEDETRMDMGSIRVRGVDGLQMQVQMDERTGAVSMITLGLGDASVQVQAFAAPRSAGIWPEIRAQIASSITSSGGLAEEVAGEFGGELSAQVPGPGGALQPARFVGVDGPRWFLRGLFLGSAAPQGGSAELEAVFRDLVVVRGTEAMAPGEPLPLTLPSGAQATKVEG